MKSTYLANTAMVCKLVILYGIGGLRYVIIIDSFVILFIGVVFAMMHHVAASVCIEGRGIHILYTSS